MKRAVACLLATAVVAAGQAPGKVYKAPRTPDGVPDLQGYWTNITITPLTRPANVNKAFFTPEEARQYEKDVVSQNNADRRDGGAQADLSRAYNDVFYDRGTKVVETLRTSLIVDPPDGQIPRVPNTGGRGGRGGGALNGPEDLPLATRCILWATAGPPMLSSFYNNNYQIVQGPGYAVILVEMVHDARIIPIDPPGASRPHLASSVRQWLGDPRGHWEGDTLVVESTNFTDKTRFQGATQNMKLTERFTRTAADTLTYEFTVEDPAAFTKPWTGQIPMKPGVGPIVEYACNEGNYSMAGVLAGARADEKKAAGR